LLHTSAEITATAVCCQSATQPWPLIPPTNMTDAVSPAATPPQTFLAQQPRDQSKPSYHHITTATVTGVVSSRESWVTASRVNWLIGHVGHGSQNVTHCQLLAANRQSGGEDRCYSEKFRNSVAWAEPDPKTAFFRVFRVPFDYPAHRLQETVLPQTNDTDGEPRLWRCAFC